MSNCCLHTHASKDPTRTATIRKRFESDLVARFRLLRSRVRDVIVKQNGFNINVLFDFSTSEQKITAFNAWLKQQQRSGAIALLPADERQGAPAGNWPQVYVDSAYQQGIRRARAELRMQNQAVPRYDIDTGFNEVQAAFMQPFHIDRVGLIYSRVYSDLEGITQEMDKQISRQLAQGIAEGRNPLQLANDIVDRIDKIGITRARMLARTEIIRAHHSANIQEYKNAGVDDVRVIAEWVTAGDARVCPECEALQDKTFTIKAIESAIPLHPNCRCVAVPVLSTDTDLRKVRRRDPRAN